MQTLKLHCVYGVIITCTLPLLFYQAHPFDDNSSAEPVRNLHELNLRLLNNGVHLRAVPQRADGLWLGALYLTQTEQNAEELKNFAIQPSAIEQWYGTVIIFEEGPGRDTRDWGENGLRWKQFLFYGDQAILNQIRKALEK